MVGMRLHLHKDVLSYLSSPPFFPESGRFSVLVYGAGTTGRRVAEALQNRGHMIGAFLDAGTIDAKTINDIVVMTPDEWCSLNSPENCIVVISIANAKYADELVSIDDALRKRGFCHVVDHLEICHAFHSLYTHYTPIPPTRDFLNRHSSCTMGKLSYTAPGCEVFQPDILSPRLIIGSYVSIAANVTFLLERTGGHRPGYVTTYTLQSLLPEDFSTEWHGDTIVGNDVWIGRGAMVLGGVTIGHGAIVGAGAVVSRDVAPYSIVVGNPARHVHYRFSEPVCKALLKTEWWDWPLNELRRVRHLLFSDSIEAFLHYAEERLPI